MEIRGLGFGGVNINVTAPGVSVGARAGVIGSNATIDRGLMGGQLTAPAAASVGGPTPLSGNGVASGQPTGFTYVARSLASRRAR